MTTEQATALKSTLESMFEHIAQKESIVDDLEQIERLQQEFASTVPAQATPLPTTPQLYQSARFFEG